MSTIKDKKVLIMGLGLHGGGVGAARFFATRGARVTITDLRSAQELCTSLEQLKKFPEITYILGRHRRKDFLHADLIIKNPGVPPTSPYIIAARKKGIPISSDIGIFLRECKAPIIGITGTRGKSTTCALIFNFLEAHIHKDKKQKKRHVFLGGNIRTSALEFLDRAAPCDIVILELSSFQLDDLARDSWNEEELKKSPHIAVITNIMRDHLNWHSTMREYIKSKSTLFSFQTSDDVLIANSADPMVKKMIRNAKANVISPRLPSAMASIIDKNLGAHYRSSAALAITAAQQMGATHATIVSVLKTFRGLPGRQEIIAHLRGVTYINDTTATIPEASIAAILRFRQMAKKSLLILIAGGSDKRLVFTRMAETIAAHVDHCILLPGSATAQLLLKLHKKFFAIQNAASMDEAVRMAAAHSKKGDYIVLSPGAASFGLFANEFDRGDKFIAAVNAQQ